MRSRRKMIGHLSMVHVSEQTLKVTTAHILEKECQYCLHAIVRRKGDNVCKMRCRNKWHLEEDDRVAAFLGRGGDCKPGTRW